MAGVKANLKTLWKNRRVKIVVNYTNSELDSDTGDIKESVLILEGYIINHLDNLIHVGDENGKVAASVPLNQIKLVIDADDNLFGALQEANPDGNSNIGDLN